MSSSYLDSQGVRTETIPPTDPRFIQVAEGLKVYNVTLVQLRIAKEENLFGGVFTDVSVEMAVRGWQGSAALLHMVGGSIEELIKYCMEWHADDASQKLLRGE